MSTLRVFFFLAFAWMASTAVGQSGVNPEIKKTFDEFIMYSNNKNWDKAFDLLYPKMFNQVPKQELVNIMQSTDQDGMSILMSNVNITSSSEPMQEGAETFVRINYIADLQVAIKRGGLYDAPKPIMGMEQQFKDLYGANNVKWNASNYVFDIHATKSMMAVNSGNGKWGLVEINMDQPAVMKAIFPDTVMQKLVLKQ